MIRFPLAVFLFVLTMSVLSPAQGGGQDPTSASQQSAPTASLSGTVTDTNHAAVPDATVVLTSDTGANLLIPINGKGTFSINGLWPGTYTLTVSAASLADQVSTVTLTRGVESKMDVSLKAENAEAKASAQEASAGGNNQAEASASSTVEASSSTGEKDAITGTVTDQTGAVVVGATVKVTSTTGAVRTAVTNEKGNYSVKNLAAGTYKLTVSAPGFKDFATEGVTLAAGSAIPLDANLEPAGAVSSVNVESQGVSQVETQNADVSGTITQKEVVEIGLNGRNFTQLIALAPGVSNQTGQDEAKVGITGSVKYSVNGGRVEYNTFDVDGSDVLNAGLNGAESTLIVYPSLDAIQEVKVLTSNFGAMYGRTASGQVLVTTKSGGQQFHGNGYEFIRNEFFNARNYFDFTSKAPLYRRNDFGFTFGGPIFIPQVYNSKRDKTYFFVSEEFHYEKTPVEFNAAVPTVAERGGDFSDVCPAVTQGSSAIFTSPSQFPDCPRSSPNTGFPSNYVVQASTTTASGVNPGNSTIDANASALLNTNLIPLPNSFTGCNSSLVGQTDPETGRTVEPCYVATISPSTYWREDLFRIDQNITPKVLATFRYIHDSWDTTVLNPQWGAVKNSFPTVENRFVGPGTSLVVRLSETITPSLLNVFVASYTNSHITLTDQNGPGGANVQRPAGLTFPSGTLDPVSARPQYPMGYLFNNGFGGKAPGIVIGGTNAEYGGNGFAVDPSYMPWEHTSPTIQWRDDVSKQRGRHFLQFGVQYVYAQKNETNGAIGAASGDLQGILTFTNINQGYQGNGTGNAFANFLTQLGGSAFPRNAIASFTQDSAQLRYYNRYTIAEPYFQDDWKVTRRLTLNLGLRLSLFGDYHEKYLHAYNFEPSLYDPTLAAQLHVDPNYGIILGTNGKPIPINLSSVDPRLLNGIVECGPNGVPPSCMKNHLFNYAPRFGFAWDPRGDGKTSVRGGYGIFYEHGTGNEANTGSLEGSAPLVLSMTQRFPANYACIGGVGFVADGSGANCPVGPGAYPLNITAIPTQVSWPYAQQWSLSVQRELTKDTVATFAYVGSKGTHLTVQRQLNQLNPVPTQLNPFGPHEPIISSITGNAGDCAGWTGDPSQGGGGTFRLLNGTVVSARNPAYYNLEAACQGVLASGTTVPDVNTLRPYPGYAQIYDLENIANSEYNAFQTTARRTHGPLTLGVSYTYSHSIDESSDRSNTTFVNTLDLQSNRASSDFDQRHLLNVSYVYSIPSLRYYLDRFSDWVNDVKPTGKPSQPATSSRLSRTLLDGWEASGVTLFASGTPFSVVNGGGSNSIGLHDNAGVANGIGPGSYPDLARGPIPPVATTPNFINGVPNTNTTQSFGPLLGNPNMFVAPRGLTFGNAGRNFLNNPHRLNFDIALLKYFKIRENNDLEFRIEAFNLFNHTQFRIYDPNNPGSSGNNVINCYGGPDYSAGFVGGGTDCLSGNSFLHPVDAHRPRTMQFGLKYSF